MPLSEFEQKRFEKIAADFVRRRRPRPEIRDQVDLGFRLENQTVLIFQLRPAIGLPGKMVESRVAKMTYVKTYRHWRLYWLRASGKWERYPTEEDLEQLEDALAIVDADELGGFWG